MTGQNDVVINIMAKTLGFKEATKKVTAAINKIHAASNTSKKSISNLKNMAGITGRAMKKVMDPDLKKALLGSKSDKDIMKQFPSIKNFGELSKKYSQAVQESKKVMSAQDHIDQAVAENAKKQSRVVESMSAAERKKIDGLHKNGLEINNLSKGYDSFGQAIRMPFEQWKKLNAEGGKFTSGGAKFANRVRMITHGMRGFRMALLGVMFAGQNLNKSMMKLLQPAMQARGITEKWQKGLKDVFLPVIKAIEPAIKAIAKWMKELSPAAKMVIGGFVIFTAVVGKLLFLIGSFGLAIGSLIMLLPSSRNKLVEVTATMTAYTAATVAATIATGAFTIATGGMSSVLGSFGGVTTGLIKPLKLLEKGFKGSGLHAAVKATTPEVKKFTTQFAKTSKLLKASKKIVRGTEKAFKGSGLHAAVKATRFEVKDFTVGLLTMDFVLGNSGKKIPWYTKLWMGVVDVFNLAISALRTWLGLDTPDTPKPPEPPKPDVAGPEDTVMTPTGGVSTAFPNLYKPDTDYWSPGVISEGNKIIAKSIGETQMAKTGGGAGSQEQGTLVTDLIKAPWWPGMNNPIVPEAPIPTAPSLFEQLAARRGVDVGSEYSRATEQVEASQTIVQVYVDGSEVTSRFNERIIDSTKNMGAF